VWGPIAEYAGVKVSKLLAESQLGAARQREREVEVGLAQSQLNFRNERLTGLEGQLKEDGQFAGWLEATGETLLAWLTGQSWRIAIGLLLIWVGLQFALRLVGRVSGVIMEHAEGEPDNADDVDQRSKTLATVFEGMARIALYIVAALLALEQIGVNTAPILGSVAILGLAVSFGSQNLVRDVVNGFFILLENQYAVGEFVNIGGKSGTVEKITIRSTWIKAATGDLHVIPNGSVTSVTNSQRTWARSICEIGVAYDADLAKVKEVIDRVGQEMAAEEEWFSKFYEEDGETDVPAWVGVTALGDSAVTVRAWVKVDAGQQWGVERELNRRFKLAFDAAGIEIPFPQRVVHNKSA
jgi:small conductance mechanosensitive channel